MKKFAILMLLCLSMVLSMAMGAFAVENTEQPAPKATATLSGEIKVTTTETYEWCAAQAFVAEKAGKYTFTVPAGLSVLNEDEAIKDPWFAPYVDFNMNPNGGTFTLELTAGQKVNFVFQAATKADWTITWAAEVEAAPAASSGEIKVTTTETYEWCAAQAFVAEKAGKYTFTVPAGLSVLNEDEAIKDPWFAPYVDFNMNPNGGTFTLELTAGQKVNFVFQAATKADWTITWTAEIKEEVQSPTSGEIKVTTTETYEWCAAQAFVAEKAGKYTFTVPAGLSVLNEDEAIKDPWFAPYVDFNMNPNGGTFTLELTAGQKVNFVFQAATKADWTITWTAEIKEEVQSPTSGEIKVTTTETYEWCAPQAFVAEKAGKYTFTVPAGLSVLNKDEAIKDPWFAPYVDFNMNPNGGTFTLELTAGQKVNFVFQAATKADWTITWTVEGVGDKPQQNIAVLGENSIVVPEGVEYVEYTFVVEKAGEYTFASNDLRVRIVDANGMPIMATFLEPGTYTLQCGPMVPAAGTYILNITAVFPKVTAQLGENFITIEQGTEGTEVEFVVDKAGNYKFAGDLIVQVCDANGNVIFRGQGYLEPGTYTLKCAALAGMTGTFKIKITTDAYDTPKLELGENKVVIENGELGAEFTLEVTEEGYYTFTGKTEGVYAVVIVRDADGNIVIKGEGTLAAGTYTVAVMFTNDDAEGQVGEFVLEVAAKVEFTGTIVEQLPTTITGTAENMNDTYQYTATEDCFVDIINVNNALITLVNGDDIIWEDLENGKRITLKAGESVIFNPWCLSGEFEITVQIYDPETEVGGAKNPETMTDAQGTTSLNFPASEGYHFSWSAAKDGKVTFTLNELETLDGEEILVNGTALTLEGKSVTIDVAAGDKISIVCKGAAETSSILLDVKFEEKTAEPEPTDPPATNEPTTPPTTGTTGNTEEPSSPVVIIVIVVVVIAAAVVAVVVLKKKK